MGWFMHKYQFSQGHSKNNKKRVSGLKEKCWVVFLSTLSIAIATWEDELGMSAELMS